MSKGGGGHRSARRWCELIFGLSAAAAGGEHVELQTIRVGGPGGVGEHQDDILVSRAVPEVKQADRRSLSSLGKDPHAGREG
eukprot:499469-Rhodomonas_salina.1